ncbi:hypothetical protein K7432_009415 [Basidiobolus ranarum]|uniref:Late embryogenesis abundant protein LEA-2 subgroup domain-containing protein n=1 Tax=Basidiobolus ranarum TaxID=34480 RepID=A0ABR2WQD9_9FUNG
MGKSCSYRSSYPKVITNEYSPQQARGKCCYCFGFLLCLIFVGAGITTFLLYVRAPGISFNAIVPPEQGVAPFALEGTQTIVFNFRLNITVVNPNFVGAKFDKIIATGYHPLLPGVKFGNGTLKDVNITQQNSTVLVFPFALYYGKPLDPEDKVLKDIAGRCGLIPGKEKKPITIEYEIELYFSISTITGIAPTIRGKAEFECPIPVID